jgi:hypothetical protein
MEVHTMRLRLAAVPLAAMALVMACALEPLTTHLTGAPAAEVDLADPVHPLAQRQATVQAEQAPALQRAREGARIALATREAVATAVADTARTEAITLLRAAVSRRQAGLFGEAIELARQAQEKWPDYGDAREFLDRLAPTATAQARVARAQATAAARPTATPRPGVRGSSRPETPAPALPPVVPPSASETALFDEAINIIQSVDVGLLHEIATTLTLREVTIGFGALPPGAGAIWRPAENAITISDRYQNSSVEGIAGILVHEGTHVYDYARGRFSGTSADCYDLEGRAFANQAKLWEALYGPEGKKGTTDQLEREMNRILLVVNEKPLSFALELLAIYKHQCR